jgi:hypothetical protein
MRFGAVLGMAVCMRLHGGMAVEVRVVAAVVVLAFMVVMLTEHSEAMIMRLVLMVVMLVVIVFLMFMVVMNLVDFTVRTMLVVAVRMTVWSNQMR